MTIVIVYRCIQVPAQQDKNGLRGINLVKHIICFSHIMALRKKQPRNEEKHEII